jgi:hypothetical protein
MEKTTSSPLSENEDDRISYMHLLYWSKTFISWLSVKSNRPSANFILGMDSIMEMDLNCSLKSVHKYCI